MIDSIRAAAELQFSHLASSEDCQSNSAKLAAFRAAKQVKDASIKASQRQERRRKRVA
jgi:hypothetical protein